MAVLPPRVACTCVTVSGSINEQRAGDSKWSLALGNGGICFNLGALVRKALGDTELFLEVKESPGPC